MELIPAIDLLDGRVVRLVQGDFDRSTEFGDDPVAIAQHWAAQGATRLHVVDLDGARAGSAAQRSIVERVIASVSVPCQVAGGIRTADDAAAYLAAGADRVVLGTALLRDPDLARRLIGDFGAERIVAAIDVVDGRAVGEGWRLDGISGRVGEAIPTVLEAGLRRLIATAIAQDGMLDGPDLDLLGRVRRLAPDAALIASGGVTTAEDVTALAGLGCEGAIVGRALYEGRITLAEVAANVH